ncbi:MAG: helix-turn-helix transcriptional regulator [Oscillospiraceae bacterium]|nr:helix-turn-helix transcriptional regulator [Oscillospiraceae bacterium]
MDIIKVFGANVRKYRLEKKFSQEKFAELSGLHRTYISDIECFRRSISLDNIQKIADALGIETYKLFIPL